MPLFLAVWLASPAGAQTTATVKRDRVNVRGQPSIFGEVITQLRKDEVVVVLDEIKLAKPKAGEPVEWAKIQMPANTPVWVNAAYIDPASKTVKAKRLNLRAGPGENYSVVGLLTMGAEVKEIRVEEDWMEIETPTNAYAFVASEFLEKRARASPSMPPPPAPKTAPQPEAGSAARPLPPQAERAADTPPVPVPAPQNAPQPPPSAGPSARSEAPKPHAAATSAENELVLPSEPKSAQAEPPPLIREETPLITDIEVAPAQPAKRIVRREGLVKPTINPQAPTQFQLVSPQTGKALDYLYPKSAELKIKDFRGRRVVVTGEELIDPRWPKTPVLAVETIELTP